MENCHEASCECSNKTKERSPKEYKDMMNRLKRIEGQVRGIQGMIEKDAYCTDVLIQVAAVNAALNSFSKALLANHIHSCVADNIRAGNDEVIDELVILLEKLMK
ncbi:MAG: metal-sensing transcriptional repressor [Lachnospiraceae bacterium]|nr:metal-sensing transcriptional repressor [Lachnospiraceae bacterium]